MGGVTGVIRVTALVVAQELAVIESAALAGVEHVVKVTSKASIALAGPAFRSYGT